MTQVTPGVSPVLAATSQPKLVVPTLLVRWARLAKFPLEAIASIQEVRSAQAESRQQEGFRSIPVVNRARAVRAWMQGAPLTRRKTVALVKLNPTLQHL